MIAKIIYGVAFINLIRYTYCAVDSKEKKRRDVVFYCQEYEDCQPGGPKICGFDEEVSHLAYFDSICTMFKANCKSAGIYEEVAMHVCDTKRDYSTSFKDELEFVKIIRPTPPINDMPLSPKEDSDETLRNNTKVIESFYEKGNEGVEIEKEIKVDTGNSTYANDLLYILQRISLLPKGGRKTLDIEGERELN